MDQFVDILQRQWDFLLASAPRIVAAVAVVLFSHLVGRLVATGVMRVFRRFADESIPGPLADPPLSVHITGLLPNYVQLSVVHYWVDVFDKTKPVIPMQDRMMNVTRAALMEGGYTVSSEVSTVVELKQVNVRTDESDHHGT